MKFKVIIGFEREVEATNFHDAIDTAYNELDAELGFDAQSVFLKSEYLKVRVKNKER